MGAFRNEDSKEQGNLGTPMLSLVGQSCRSVTGKRRCDQIINWEELSSHSLFVQIPLCVPKFSKNISLHIRGSHWTEGLITLFRGKSVSFMVCFRVEGSEGKARVTFQFLLLLSQTPRCYVLR